MNTMSKEKEENIEGEEDFQALDKLIEEEARKAIARKRVYCSRCGSTNITYYIGQYLGSLYQCKDCGHINNFIIEDGLIGEKIREEYLEREKKGKERDSAKK